jgi:hypothetical protein
MIMSSVQHREGGRPKHREGIDSMVVFILICLDERPSPLSCLKYTYRRLWSTRKKTKSSLSPTTSTRTISSWEYQVGSARCPNAWRRQTVSINVQLPVLSQSTVSCQTWTLYSLTLMRQSLEPSAQDSPRFGPFRTPFGSLIQNKLTDDESTPRMYPAMHIMYILAEKIVIIGLFQSFTCSGSSIMSESRTSPQAPSCRLDKCTDALLSVHLNITIVHSRPSSFFREPQI